VLSLRAPSPPPVVVMSIAQPPAVALLVELRGIEPLACTLRTYRSTN
jgi:hypothetical protein